MSTFKSTFPGKHVFLPVIHVLSARQAMRNAKIAKEGGADGIFLINHVIPYQDLLECYEIIKRDLPDLWVGLNCLELGRLALDFIPNYAAGLWVDDAGVTELGDPAAEAKVFTQKRKQSPWQGIYFGGVAFKYQKRVGNVAKVAKFAVPHVDVITTSGEGTGQAAPLTKIRTMREAIGDHPLAIASGITPHNVSNYTPYVNCFLVATGISHTETELNSEKVRALAKALKC